MELMGIKFAPLFIPLHRRLETLAVAAALIIFLFGGVTTLYFLIYLILYTNYWKEALAYIIWIYVIDINTCEQGGRTNEWVRGWAWWKHYSKYFQIRLERAPGVELDPKRNYLFCSYPHGILPFGMFAAFGSKWGGFHELFPSHTPHTIFLKQNFYLPISRELILATGGCSPSKNSLNYLLGFPKGGKVAILSVGGAAEAFNSNSEEYRIVLKNRKGFIKIALTNGSPLVPVFTFGETNLYYQFNSPKGSLLRNFQEWIKDKTGIAPVIPLGRGFFQYSFGILPQRTPLRTIIGKPIDVVKVENPTREQINALHEEFTKRIIELFEEQKYNFVPNPQETKLIID